MAFSSRKGRESFEFFLKMVVEEREKEIIKFEERGWDNEMTVEDWICNQACNPYSKLYYYWKNMDRFSYYLKQRLG
jgi:hypothetical protein